MCPTGFMSSGDIIMAMVDGVGLSLCVRHEGVYVRPGGNRSVLTAIL